MTKKFRTTLFSLLVVLFILIAPLVILFSQGYRFDWETRKITQTGAFYFKTLPKSTEVYLNGKLEKKSDFLFGTAFIDDLLPKKYEVKIEKQGYYPWQKSLEIQEKTVTEAKNIVLIAENPNFELLAKQTEDFFFSPDEKKMILKKTYGEIWNLEILDLDKNLLTNLIDEKKFFERKNRELLDIEWSQDSKRVLLTFEIKKAIKHFILETTKESNLISIDFLGKDIKEISFSPQKDSEIFFVKKNTLLKADFIKKEISKPILNNLISYELLNSNLVWLNDEGFLFKSNLLGEKIEVLNLKPLEIESGTEYKITAHDLSKILVQKSDTLFFLDQDSRTFKEISNSVKNFRFSQDFKKLVFWNNYEIWILFLEEKLDQPKKEAKELLFLTRFSEKIEQVFWYTSHYLIFNTGNKLKIVEIDDRDKINIIELTSFEKPKIFWNKNYKNLYILTNGSLFSSEKLIP